MICVSIGRSSIKSLIAEHHQLVEHGAQLVELRIDYLEGSIDLKPLLENRPSPVIITCRRVKDGGKFQESEERRLVVLRSAIAQGADYVDLEEDVAGSIPRFGPTKRIVSLHDFRRTPADLDQAHARLVALDADIVKLATLAHSPHDNVRMLQLMQKSPVPTVGVCMGEIGTPSRILAPKFGAPFTFATFSSERQMAPGQLSFREMEDIYGYSRITPDTEVYGVIGDPIQHSYSPQIHNAAFQALGLNKVYIPFRVPRGEVPRFLEDAPALGIRGISVTIPHKQTVLAKATQIDPLVEGAGAANTLIFSGNQIHAYNTDAQAALESLELEMRQKDQNTNPFAGKPILVLGAGGAARAIAFGLKQRGAEVYLSGRTAEKAKELAEKLDCRLVPWEERGGVRCAVLVNCTPVGMHPNVDECPVEKHMLRPAMVVFDTVYNPENTLLLKHARTQHAKPISGIEMFVRQAALQFQLFTGHPAPTDLMRDILRRAIAPARS